MKHSKCKSVIKLFESRLTMKVILVFILLLISCAKKTVDNERKRDETVPVTVMVLTPETFIEEGTYFGIIEPVETADIVCYSGGRVEKINISERQRVKKGFSLAHIDPARASSALNSAKAQQDIAKSMLDQTVRLLQIGNSSQIAVRQQKLTYLNAHSTYVDALKNYRGAFAVSPINGIVTRKYIDIYQEIPPNTKTFTVSRLDTVKVGIGITETDIFKVHPGSAATLTIPMVQDRKWHGRIKNLAAAAGSEDRVFSAEIYFENRDHFLMAGISGRVELYLNRYDSVIVVPTGIITVEGIKSSIMVVDSAGFVHKRFIETGPQSDTQTMVKSGLAFNERVITDGFQLVREGTAVKIQNPGKEQ
ncbi:MAG: efflux RND transporter periplasmic adaptor subunit [Fibrobacter sp.]|nr:efflux RND transporter periplasmic adaptor subunit [Fibrobacter sp.]